MDIEEYVRNNPHDTFFKETFTQKENAISFLKNYLPEEIKEIVNTNNIKIEKDSFVSEELDENFSDILYRVELDGEEGYIYTLFEHKSNPDYNTSLQLLEYLVKVWQAKQKQKEELPIVIPLLVYHGEEEWKVSKRFSDMLEAPDEKLLQYTPDFEYILHDFSQYEDKEIIGTDELRARLKLMKHIKEQIERLWDLYRDEVILNRLISAAIYILSAREEDNRLIINKIKEISRQGGKTMSTAAEQLIKEGKEEGIKEGIKEGVEKGKRQEQIEIAKNMLKEEVDIETIARITKLSKEKIEELKKQI